MQHYIDHLSAANHCLYKSEKKGIANIHPAYDLWFDLEIQNIPFYGFHSRHLVRQILNEKFLLKAQENYPESFNTENPHDVLEAIRKESKQPNIPMPEWENLPAESQQEANERIFKDYHYLITDETKSKVLRLDLFRHIGEKDGRLDYKGGLLHAYKHFVQEGKPISHKSEPLELPSQFEQEIIKCLFFKKPFNTRQKEDGNEIIEYRENIAGKSYRIFFYHNANCGVYFLDSIYINSKTK